MTATTTLPVLFGTGIHASRPSASAVGAGGLYACSTHALIYQSDGVSTWSTWATLTGTGLSDPMTTRGDVIVRNASNVTARLAIGASGKVLSSDGTDVSWQTPSGSGSDPIATLFGTPDVAYEFDTSSFTGLTSFGTLVTEDANTSVPGHYYARNTQNANPYIGGRTAAVTAPFTAITKVHHSGLGNTGALQAGLILGAAALSSGFDLLSNGHVNGSAFCTGIERWTNLGAYAGNTGLTFVTTVGPYVYLAIAAASNSSVNYYWSYEGYVWKAVTTARNPSLTLAQVGLATQAQNTAGVAAAFDYLRIWNSAKTFPS